MDIIKFINPDHELQMRYATVVEGIESKTWIERFDEAGEFTLVAGVDSGLMQELPLGTFISHVDSEEVMMVEHHQVTDEGDGIPKVTITGRGFEVVTMEHRAIGNDHSFPRLSPLPSLTAPKNLSWLQVVFLMRNHMYESLLVDPANAIPYTYAAHNVVGEGQDERRPMKRGNLYERVREIFKVDGLGMKLHRPGRISDIPGYGEPDDRSFMLILVHRGFDRTQTVGFSHSAGEVTKADYLWSVQTKKNCAYVYGRWIDTFVYYDAWAWLSTHIHRRIMDVDASDIDQAWEENPEGEERNLLTEAMRIRGQQALAAQQEEAIARVELAEYGLGPVYRKDYGMGDFVMVHNDYMESVRMRVTEHVEIEDENGVRAYPTLTNPTTGPNGEVLDPSGNPITPPTY